MRGINRTGVTGKIGQTSALNTMGKNSFNNGYSFHGKLGFGGLTRQVGKTNMEP